MKLSKGDKLKDKLKKIEVMSLGELKNSLRLFVIGVAVFVTQ